MSFPLNPTNNQTATVNNIVYLYNSTKGAWLRQFSNVSTGGGSSLSLTAANVQAVIGAVNPGSFPTLNQNTTGSAASATNAVVAQMVTGLTAANVQAVIGSVNPSSFPALNQSPSTYSGSLTSSQITQALGFTPYNNTNPSGYINGITSTMVTNALGFTPYNNSNPNGYVANGNSPSFGATSTGPLTVSGNITATGDITAFFSDRRLKTNIRPITDAIDKIMSLHGVTYMPNELAKSFGFVDDSVIPGLFTDEVADVFPYVVKPAPFDTDASGHSKSGQNYKTVQYEKLVPLLVEAIKEQQIVIEQQQSQITEILALLKKSHL
jgi:hypothetical protein